MNFYATFISKLLKCVFMKRKPRNASQNAIEMQCDTETFVYDVTSQM